VEGILGAPRALPSEGRRLPGSGAEFRHFSHFRPVLQTKRVMEDRRQARIIATTPTISPITIGPMTELVSTAAVAPNTIPIIAAACG
jgi:hypothetical protein